MKRRRKAPAVRKVWEPMTEGAMNPAYRETVWPDGFPEHVLRVEVWGNDLYDSTVEHYENGWAYITLKRRDRKAVRDWRHLQSIKNEIVGAEREAFEIFPRESRLMDEANQYHLWVLPEGESIGWGPQRRFVLDHQATQARVRGEGKARQRPWQPGLSTGPEATT